MLLAFLFVFTSFPLSGAQAAEISAASAIVLDAATLEVLYQKNADEERPIASTTKILPSLIACESGKLDETVNAMFSASMRAVEVSISLIGVMALWLGFVKIAQKSGLIELFAKIISPLLRFIFNELPKDSPAFSNIALNISANALGLSNAATPFGIKAMKDLKKESNSSFS